MTCELTNGMAGERHGNDMGVAWARHGRGRLCESALIHTCHAAPLPCSDSAISFVKDWVVAGNIRTASPTV
jgi:type 1 glutamine amidotransferase